MEQPSSVLPFQLHDDEQLVLAARTEPELLAIADRRIIVASEYHTALDLPVAGLRRGQLDIEVGRPATLVLVPHEPLHRPQVLLVPHEELETVTRAAYLLGDRLRAIA